MDWGGRPEPGVDRAPRRSGRPYKVRPAWLTVVTFAPLFVLALALVVVTVVAIVAAATVIGLVVTAVIAATIPLYLAHFGPWVAAWTLIWGLVWLRSGHDPDPPGAEEVGPATPSDAAWRKVRPRDDDNPLRP